MSLEGGINF